MGIFRSESKQDLIHDLLTGVVIALLSMPLAIGYAQMAGLPPRYGLYGSLLSILVCGLLTSSPRFVFGVDAAPAALVGTILPALGIAHSSDEAVAVMPAITLITAFWLFLFWLLRGGHYAKFISEPVLGGCVSGIATVVILTQLPRLFGGAAISGRAPALVMHLIEESENFHTLSFILGAVTVVAILVARRRTKMSFSIVAMAIGIALGGVVRIDRYGVELLGAVGQGLPRLADVNFSVLSAHPETVLVDTLAVALVITAETLVTTRGMGQKYDDAIDNQRELLTYALGNIAAAFCGSSPVSGSVSRTRRANALGVKSQWMSVFACATLALFLLLGTPLLAWLPVPVLTGIVIASLITMLEFSLAGHLWKYDRSKFFVFAAAFGAELLGLSEGVVVGVILTFASFTVRSTDQPTYFLGCLPGKHGFYDLSKTPHALPIEDTVIYEFNGTLFFASIEDFELELRRALDEDTRLVVVTGVSAIDLFAAERLLEFYHKLKKRGISFYLAGHASSVNEELIQYGAEELIREGVVRQRLTQALAEGGLEYPYPLRAGARSPEHASTPGSVALEDFNWAYGKYAVARMDHLARQLVTDILNDGKIDETQLTPVEREVADEYWNSVDETEFQKLLEMAQEIAAGTRPAEDEEFTALMRELLGRRMRLELNLSMRGDAAAAREFTRLRLRMEEDFLGRYPAAGALLREQRIAYTAELRQHDKVLARVIEDLTRRAAEEVEETR